VNEAIRRGLMHRQRAAPATAFKKVARDLGNLKPGDSLDKIGDLLERTEGPLHR
jgi:hypothetical protein